MNGQTVSEYIIVIYFTLYDQNAILKSFCEKMNLKEEHDLDDSMFQWK